MAAIHIAMKIITRNYDILVAVVILKFNLYCNASLRAPLSVGAAGYYGGAGSNAANWC